MHFFDETGELVTCYDPEGYGLTFDAQVRTIGPGEELIGVYGVKGKERWFTSLGFITSKKVYPKTVGVDESLN